MLLSPSKKQRTAESAGRGTSLTISAQDSLPQHLPQLRELIVTGLPWGSGQGAALSTQLCASIARVLPQLRKLSIKQQEVPWDSILTTTAPHLTHLAFEGELNAELVGLVLQHAPALQSLTVDTLADCDTDCSDSEWGVTSLVYTYGNPELDDSLVWLPRCKAGARLSIQVTNQPGSPRPWFTLSWTPEVVERLSEWRFLFKTALQIEGISGQETDAASLGEQLTQLSRLEAPNTAIEISRNAWSSKTLKILAAHLPTLSHLRFGTLFVHHLGDSELTQLLRMGRVIRKLLITRLQLESDQHASAAWPWKEVTIDMVDVALLTKLPRPSGRTATIRYKSMDLTDVTQAHVKPLKAWYKHVQFDPARHFLAPEDEHEYDDDYLFEYSHGACSPDSSHVASIHSTFFLGHPDDTTGATFKAQLSVLQALPLVEDDEMQNVVSLRAPMTQDVMTALAALPQWQMGRLDVSKCTWPLPASAYKQLAQHVPVCYSELVHDFESGSEVLKQVSAGVPERQQGGERLELVKHVKSFFEPSLSE